MSERVSAFYERISQRKLVAACRRMMAPYRREDGYIPERAAEQSLSVIRSAFYRRGYAAGFKAGREKAIRDGRCYTRNGAA